MSRLPRFKKNLFITNEKSITRTLNKYIEYKGVLQIYLSYNEKNKDKDSKYQIHLNLENEDFEEPKDSLLVYDKPAALLKKHNTSILIDSINTIEIKDLWNESTINKTIDLINSYKTNEFNMLFKTDKTRVIEQIKEYIPYIGSYTHKPSGLEIDNKEMISKRLYSTISNSVNYTIRSNKYHSLRNKVKIKKEDRLKKVKEELDKTDLISIYKLKEIEIKQVLFYLNIDLNKVDLPYSYKDLIISIELNGEYDLTGDLTIEELLYEKEMYEDLIRTQTKEDNIEYNIKKEILSSYKMIIYKKYKDYLKIVSHFKKNDIKVSKFFVSKYLKDFTHKVEKMGSRSGLKRKKQVKILELEYGINFRKHSKRLNDLNKEDYKLLIDTIILLDNYNYCLIDLFNDKELEEIKNETYLEYNKDFNYYSSSFELTKYEKIKNSGFYDLKNNMIDIQENLNSINEELDILCFEENTQDKKYIENLYQQQESLNYELLYLEDILRDLWTKLEKIPFHKYTVDYLKYKK